MITVVLLYMNTQFSTRFRTVLVERFLYFFAFCAILTSIKWAGLSSKKVMSHTCEHQSGLTTVKLKVVAYLVIYI